VSIYKHQYHGSREVFFTKEALSLLEKIFYFFASWGSFKKKSKTM